MEGFFVSTLQLTTLQAIASHARTVLIVILETSRSIYGEVDISCCKRPQRLLIIAGEDRGILEVTEMLVNSMEDR